MDIVLITPSDFNDNMELPVTKANESRINTNLSASYIHEGGKCRMSRF
jgi:hypothetical protein